jgi:galacturan 1,4-alpha-galacturonidase
VVENVWVENIVMAHAQNGARIKVFGGNPSPTSISGGGKGHVRSKLPNTLSHCHVAHSSHCHRIDVTFKSFKVEDVDHPILIDQCYMTAAATCSQFPSNLTISDVHYINVHGTASASQNGVVASLKCSL